MNQGKLIVTCGIALCAYVGLLAVQEHKKFVILIASYNNEKWCEWNVRSALQQKYDNFRIIYVDDCSSDQTPKKVQQLLKQEDTQGRTTYIRNQKREGNPLANHYRAIHDLCSDDEIVVILDGDDALAHDQVLSYLNKVYSSGDVWLTYGQFREIESGHIGFCHPMPEDVVRNNTFRQYQDLPSHLRSFCVWLFRAIRKEHLTLEDGSFLPMAGDLATMIPMIEMARDHFKFIPHILYLYNDHNPLSEYRVSRELQKKIDRYVRSLPPYEPLKESLLKK